MTKHKRRYNFTPSESRLNFTGGGYIEPVALECWKEQPLKVICNVCNKSFNRYHGNFCVSTTGAYFFICSSKKCINLYIFQNI